MLRTSSHQTPPLLVSYKPAKAFSKLLLNTLMFVGSARRAEANLIGSPSVADR